MSAHGAVAAACCAVAAAVLCWPGTSRSAGLGRLLGRHAPQKLPGLRRPGGGAGGGPAATLTGSLSLPRLPADGAVPPRPQWAPAFAGGAVPPRPRWALALAGGAGLVAGAVAGPVAGLAVAVYLGLAVRAWRRRLANRERAAAHARTLDALCALAGDLRAGLPPTTVLSGLVSSGDRFAQLTSAARQLAQETGAPLAELVERIEADARAMARSRASAAAQAAGAQATAWLLAALPLGGIALGYAIGADPGRVLLHTPLGAACAVAAIALQLVGIAWAERLSGAAPGPSR